MGLKLRLYLLVGALFALMYAAILLVGDFIGVSGFEFYAIMAVGMVVLQYLIGPYMVGMMMRVKYVSETEEPELHRIVAEIATGAGMKKPKVGISELTIPNAFAFGRTRADARLCVTRGILKLLNRDELKAVVGHEITHIKNQDMVFITLLSVLPMVLYYISYSLMWSGFLFGGRRGRDQGANPLPIIGAAMMLLYFIANLLVMYGSRIREYFADEGSVKLGNQPQHLATALYKLSYASTKVPQQESRQVAGAKAFFVTDPTRALYEVRQLKEIDTRNDGIIDMNELAELRYKTINLGFGDKLIEAFSTHPNMLRRIKRLSTLAFGA